VGFLLLCVSDRAVAIARALQARTWTEQFYDPPHAVVEDSGGYRETLGGRAETSSREENLLRRCSDEPGVSRRVP
jgi:hypothetical protein